MNKSLHLSLTLQQGSMISSLLATRPLTMLLRYTIGVLPMSWVTSLAMLSPSTSEATARHLEEEEESACLRKPWWGWGLRTSGELGTRRASDGAGRSGRDRRGMSPNRVPEEAAAEVDDHDAMSISRSRCSPPYAIRCEPAATETSQRARANSRVSGGLVGQGQVD